MTARTAAGASGGLGAFLRDGRVRPARHSYDSTELFLFSAATWNPHRIHYDLAYARDEEGYADLVVHGPLQAAWMFEVLQASLEPGVRIAEVSYRHHSLLYAGEPVEISGEPAEDPATVSLWVARVDTGERTTTGQATLRRDARKGAER